MVAAINATIRDEMARDDKVLYFGQNIVTTENDPFLRAFGAVEVVGDRVAALVGGRGSSAAGAGSAGDDAFDGDVVFLEAFDDDAGAEAAQGMG